MTTRRRTARPTMALAALTTLLLALTAIPVQAANNYNFPDRLPPDCHDNSNGNYTCGALTLGAGDIITVSSPATVTVTAAMTIGANTSINATGSASDLKFITTGFGLGVDTIMHANISSAAAGLIGARSKISGNISTGAGILTVNDNVGISGNINTTAGAVNLGASNKVNGNINTLAGVVTIGANSSTGGYITTAAGEVNLGAYNTVGSNITTAAGVVTLGEYNNIGGSINTSGGVVNLGAHGVVGGNIQTGTGAVNVDNDSRICGSIDTLLGGVITLTSNVKVGGNINTLGAGAITISSGSTVGGNMKAMVGVITLTGVQVGGDVAAFVGVITLTDTHIRGSVTHVVALLTKTRSTYNDSSVSFPAACSASPVIPTTTAAASFGALEPGVNLPWDKAARKPLYTKLVDVPFTLDIAALKTDGMLESAYVASGEADKYVQLELFKYNTTTGSACSAYIDPIAPPTTAKFTANAAGRVLSNEFTVANAYPSLLVRIRECTDSSCTGFTSTTPACSSDRFSVRPPALILSTMPMGAAPDANDDKTIRAGTEFMLSATTIGDYDGVLTLDTSRLAAQKPDKTTTDFKGIVGVLTPSTLTANAQAVIAAYSEVGYLYIGVGAYRDDGYTELDSTVGDCISGSLSNALSSDSKYGCSIGNQAMVSMGRFVPHHFKTEIVDRTPLICPTALNPADLPCSAAYSGQPFTVTITALNADDTTTRNYENLLARNVTLEAWSASGMLEAKNQNPLIMIPIPVVAGHGIISAAAAGTFTDGVASAKPAYTFPARYPAAALAAPTIIYLRARENTDIATDDATSARTVAAESIEAGVTVISGRFKVDNNYGSELLAVPVMIRTQYWNGTRFVDSTTDGQTSISAPDVARSNCKKNLRAGNDCVALILNTPAPPTMVKGALRLTLSAPDTGNTGNTGSVDVNINSSTSPWLPSTKARIGMGIYKAGPIIYLREMY